MRKIYKLSEHPSGIEPGVCFAGDIDKKRVWRQEAQEAADLIAEYMHSSSAYGTDKLLKLKVKDMGIYHKKELLFTIDEFRWDDIPYYATMSYNFQIMLTAEELKNMGFAEYERGEYTEDLHVHFNPNAWAETTDGVLAYADLWEDDVISDLKDYYPIDTFGDRITICT